MKVHEHDLIMYREDVERIDRLIAKLDERIVRLRHSRTERILEIQKLERKALDGR